MNAFQFIFQYIKRHKVQYTLGIITLFVVDFANIFIPKLTGVITDGLTAHSLDWSGVRLNLFYLFLLGLLLAVGRFFWRYFLFGASRSIEKELRNDMFSHLEKMDVEYYNEHKTGDLMTRFTSDLKRCGREDRGHPERRVVCAGPRQHPEHCHAGTVR